MTDRCEFKKAGNVEFQCYFQLASMVIGGKCAGSSLVSCILSVYDARNKT